MQPDGLTAVVEDKPLLHHPRSAEAWKGLRSKNSVMRGSFLKNPDLRREFLSLLAGRTK